MFKLLLLSLSMLLLTGSLSAKVMLINEHLVPVKVAETLKIIATAAGDDSIKITSGLRSASKQAELIIDYYIECNKGSNRPKGGCSVTFAKNQYAMACQKGIDLYRPKPQQSRKDSIALMGAAIETNLKTLGNNRGCMKHVKVPGIAMGWYAVDIAPSSVANHAKFYDAVMNNSEVNQQRFYYPMIKSKPRSPVRDSAFHIEIKLSE